MGQFHFKDNHKLREAYDFVRLVNLTEIKDGCWIWSGSKDKSGYGRININRKPKLAHRMWFYHMKGSPDGFLLCHKCDNPMCVNPDHVFLGNHSDNGRDMVRKGRYLPHQSFKTHCRNGHEYNEKNTRYMKRIIATTGAETVERACRVCINKRKNEKRRIYGRQEKNKSGSAR